MRSGTGSGWNEEEQECQVCAEASYSSGERDPRFEPDSLVWSQTSVPRPADSPSIVNVCRVCPPGRFCARAVGCSWTDSSASCPALCPTGHKCPEGTADPLPCTSSEYQDETGQSACKECPGGAECPRPGMQSAINVFGHWTWRDPGGEWGEGDDDSEGGEGGDGHVSTTYSPQSSLNNELFRIVHFAHAIAYSR